MNMRKRRLHSQTEVLGFKNEACETGCKSKPDSPAHCALCQLERRKKPRLHHAGMLSEPKVHRLCQGIERGAYVASLRVESVSDPATVTGGHAWHAAGQG